MKLQHHPSQSVWARRSTCDQFQEDFVNLGPRLAAIFVILACSSCGALLPILLRRYTSRPLGALVFVKYFGSGVIIGTGFVHLLFPAVEILGSDCLPQGWSSYPYAMALCLAGIFGTFIVELVAFRWRSRKLSAESRSVRVLEPDDETEASISEMITAVVLEVALTVHNVLIGLTLSFDNQFKILFVVLVFHQTLEGLGLGARLATNSLNRHRHIPIIAALIFGITTPVGMSIGLAARKFYVTNTTTTLIVGGTLDAVSAGILMYTGLVELLAHDFLYDKGMIEQSNIHVAFSVGSLFAGCSLMALLGKWL